jgi:hypothetical protein
MWLLRFLPVIKVVETVYVFDRNAIKPLTKENVNGYLKHKGPVN